MLMRLREILEAAVDSSWLESLTLMSDGSGRIVFATGQGSRYRIEGGSEQLYREWLAAPSKGQFFHDRVKDQYTVVRLI